jgi:hypothetical protein
MWSHLTLIFEKYWGCSSTLHLCICYRCRYFTPQPFIQLPLYSTAHKDLKSLWKRRQKSDCLSEHNHVLLDKYNITLHLHSSKRRIDDDALPSHQLQSTQIITLSPLNQQPIHLFSLTLCVFTIGLSSYSCGESKSGKTRTSFHPSSLCSKSDDRWRPL